MKMLLLLFALGAATAADLPRSPAPPEVELYIISPNDGDTVASPVTVRFGLRGMGVAAGRHTLRLLLGDHLHIPHDPPVMSKPITIIVK